MEDIRKQLGSNIPFLFPRWEDQIRRRLRVAPMSAGAAALAGLTGFGIRLALVLFATALIGQWAGIPWGPWMLILVFWGLFDATLPQRTPPLDIPSGPRIRRMVEDWTALVPSSGGCVKNRENPFESGAGKTVTPRPKPGTRCQVE